jgi:hypothetical protein
MNIPILVRIRSEWGLKSWTDLIRFANDKCNLISERAWERRAHARDEIKMLLADELREAGDLDDEWIEILIDRVADALQFNHGIYAPTFDPRASVLLKNYEGIAFNPQLPAGQLSIWTPERELQYDAELDPGLRTILEYQTGEYGLIADFGDDCTDVEHSICYLGVMCRVPLTALRASRMVEWMPRVVAQAGKPQQVETPSALEEIIPIDHPLRGILSPLEIRDAPYFEVNHIAMVMGLPAAKVYPKVAHGEIASERHGAGIKIPREEFTRLAVLHLHQRSAAKQEVLAAVREMDKIARTLRQAVETLE